MYLSGVSCCCRNQVASLAQTEGGKRRVKYEDEVLGSSDGGHMLPDMAMLNARP